MERCWFADAGRCGLDTLAMFRTAVRGVPTPPADNQKALSAAGRIALILVHNDEWHNPGVR